MLCEVLSENRIVSITLLTGGELGTKPSMDEVLQYAEPLVKKFIGQYAADLPYEHKEEIQQSARLRLFQLYASLDPEAGWKSFVYNHARGSVLDYIKCGAGFQESNWSIAKTETNESKHVYKIRERLSLTAKDGSDLEIDQIVGSHGIFSEMEFDKKQIRWSLVERMASIDPSLHMMACYILGIGIEEMAPSFDLCRSRIGQLIQAFVNRFDDPEWSDSVWFLQICYALNLCDAMGIPDVDQSTIPGNGRCGWDLNPIDLEKLPQQVLQPEQLNLFAED